MYPDVRSIIGELQNSVSNGVLVRRPLLNSLDMAKEKIDAVFKSTTMDQAAVARLALRDVLPDDFQAVDIAKYIMDNYSDDALIHSIAYRYHITAFRSYDQKHTVLAMLGDYLLAKFGFGRYEMKRAKHNGNENMQKLITRCQGDTNGRL